jgi:hypothetical protein
MNSNCYDFKAEIICNLCEQKKNYLCDIMFYRTKLKEAPDIKKELKWMMDTYVWDEYRLIYHLKKSVELFYPKYIDCLNTIILLK